jgi:hypothetical protein
MLLQFYHQDGSHHPHAYFAMPDEMDAMSEQHAVRWYIRLRSYRVLRRPFPINLSRPGHPYLDLPSDVADFSGLGVGRPDALLTL